MIPARALLRGVAVFAVVAVLSPTQLHAKPLAEETCNVLKAEKAALRKQGVAKTMRNGPQWAKANLTEPELRRIKRFLILQDHIKFRCFPPNKRKKKKADKARTASRLPRQVPLPLRKPLPQALRQQAAQPQKPAELDMEAIRDSLHGFQDADALGPGQIKPRPRGDRNGAGPAGARNAARSALNQRATMVAPLPVAAQATQPSRALTYSVRALTSEDLAASAGVAELEKPPQQPRRTVSRRQRAKQKVNWDPFGFDSPSN